MNDLGSILATLIAALEQWKCPGCGGTGSYRGQEVAPGGIVCRKCDGHKLHPVAFAALQKVRGI